MACDIVLGLQYGDEGKGKIVQFLINKNKYDVCARFNGGPNAGHTIYQHGKKIVTHGIPTGVIYDSEALIGPGCVIDPVKLNTEIQEIELVSGIKIRDKLKISYNAHIISEQSILEDCKNNKVGTTKCGVGPTYKKKAERTNLRVDQYVENEGTLDFIGCQVVDSYEYLKDKRVLFEGAQGFMLDIDHGKYPYVTSCNCILSQVLVSGIRLQDINDIWGVAKIYETYLGKMDFMPPNNTELLLVQKNGNEYGATTGRSRQCNWMNLDLLKKAIYINSINVLVINKCDILEGVGIYKLYSENELKTFSSMNNMKNFIIQELKEFNLKNIHFSYSPHNL